MSHTQNSTQPQPQATIPRSAGPKLPRIKIQISAAPSARKPHSTAISAASESVTQPAGVRPARDRNHREPERRHDHARPTADGQGEGRSNARRTRQETPTRPRAPPAPPTAAQAQARRHEAPTQPPPPPTPARTSENETSPSAAQRMTRPHRGANTAPRCLNRNATLVPKAEPNANPNPATIAPYSQAATARVTAQAPPLSARVTARPLRSSKPAGRPPPLLDGGAKARGHRESDPADPGSPTPAPPERRRAIERPDPHLVRSNESFGSPDDRDERRRKPRLSQTCLPPRGPERQCCRVRWEIDNRTAWAPD